MSNLLTVELQNYRRHQNVAWTLSPGVHLLIGPNGAGKTTLLRALQDMQRMASVGVEAGIGASGGAGLISWSAPERTQPRLGVTCGDTRGLIQK